MKNDEDLEEGIRYTIKVTPEAIAQILKNFIRASPEENARVAMTKESWRLFFTHALVQIHEMSTKVLQDDTFLDAILAELGGGSEEEEINTKDLPLMDMPSPSLYKN